MPKLDVLLGATSKLQRVYIRTLSTGAALTGLVFNSTGLKAYYHIEGAAAPVAITLVTMTVGTWVSGGFKEVDATNLPGVYELGIPNAALASGKSVIIMLSGFATMENCILELELTTYDPYSANGDLGLANALFPDDATDSTKYGHFVTLMRALADNSMTIISGVLRLKDRAGTGNVGRVQTITGTVPADTTRTAS